MDAINATLTRIADWMLSPFAAWPPLATLLVWSAVAGVVMTIVFRYTSNQSAVKMAADRSRAQALAIKLFGHDPLAVFSSLGQLLRYSCLRIWYSLPPMLVMLVPFVLVMSQLALRYEYTPLTKDESTIVKLELTEADWPKHQNVLLQASAEFAVETPALRDASEHAIYWRIRPQEAAGGTLRWRVGENEITKRVDVDAGDGRLASVSARRPSSAWWDRLLYPAEPALPSGCGVRGIEIEYPPRDTPLLGMSLPWWLTFVLASIVAALIVRPLVKVRF